MNKSTKIFLLSCILVISLIFLITIKGVNEGFDQPKKLMPDKSDEEVIKLLTTSPQNSISEELANFYVSNLGRPTVPPSTEQIMGELKKLPAKQQLRLLEEASYMNAKIVNNQNLQINKAISDIYSRISKLEHPEFQMMNSVTPPVIHPPIQK
jgi:hypothetical protein